MSTTRALFIFLTLSALFLWFSIDIYLKPLVSEAYEIPEHLNKELIAEGRLVWQNYNCENCHQLYGLGGHLGPDLTNEYSKLNYDEEVLRAFLKGGFSQMPRFNLSAEEEEALIEFLKAVDVSGSGDPRTYKKLFNGMIDVKHGR